MSVEIDELKRSLGYNQMFADRKNLTDAMEYVVKVGKATNHPPAVITAAMVYQNTLINVILEHFDLTPKKKK